MQKLIKETETLYRALDLLDNKIEDFSSVLLNDVTETTAKVLNTRIASLEVEYSVTVSKVDVEDTNPLSKYKRDVESIKDFLNKLIEKYKEVAIKLELSIKKTFLKLIGFVNNRASTIDALLDDLSVSPSNPEITLGLSKKVFILAGERYKPYPIENPLDLTGLMKLIDKSMKKDIELDKIFKDNPTLGKSSLDKYIKERSDIMHSDDVKKEFMLMARLDSSVYAIFIAGKGVYGKQKKSVSRSKRIKHGSSKDMETMLNTAKVANEEFSVTIDDIFSIMTDIKDFSYKSESKSGDGAFVKAANKRTVSYLKFMQQLLPWLAFNAGMHVYNHIGYTIAIAKEFNKGNR